MLREGLSSMYAAHRRRVRVEFLGTTLKLARNLKVRLLRATANLCLFETMLTLLLAQAERKATKGANRQHLDIAQLAAARPTADHQPEQLHVPHVVPSAVPAAASVEAAFPGFSGVQHTYSNELATMDDVVVLQGVESPADWAVLGTSPADQVRWGYAANETRRQ